MNKIEKDCVCITAYKGVEELRALLTALHKDFSCYVHIDKRFESRFKCLYSEFDDVDFCSDYAVNWESIEHLKAILLLLEKSVKKEGGEIYHIISGEDYPLLPNNEIYKIFYNNNHRSYSGFEQATSKKSHANRRWRYYWPYTKFSWNYKNKSIRLINLLFVGLQIVFPFYHRKKIGNIKEIYWGFVWGSYSRKAVDYILNYLKENPQFMKDLCWCKIPEELCFQTILMNSELKSLMVNNCLRFWNMERGDNSGPVYLERQGIKEMEASNSIFVRKVKYGLLVSRYLMKKRGQ